ncbi:MAG: ATP-binding protein [Polyangiaceae bacterium]|nr:ATP-binding protein [Polyangiaceae bacterium]
MLEKLSVKNVGPADEMSMELAPRLNLITGDNSLGKTFLLDVAWFGLTSTWARQMAIPLASAMADILAYYTHVSGRTKRSTYLYANPPCDWANQDYDTGSSAIHIYAQFDGRISVFDRMRAHPEIPDFAKLSHVGLVHNELWNGNEKCNGLLVDWIQWQGFSEEAFDCLKRVLTVLSPSPNDPITPGSPRRLTHLDPKRYPTLRMPSGDDLPVTLASAGIQRILALSYVLVWAWDMHLAVARGNHEPPTREIIFLIDEIDAHLHPQWQRRIVPALLNVANALTGTSDTSVQLIATTHAPLILSSVESMFDDSSDAWFDLDRVNGKVTLTKRPYISHGEVGNWLVSEAFDLPSSRSQEGERAIKFAESLGKKQSATLEEIEHAEVLLRAARMPEFDRFWVRWRYFVEVQKARIAAANAAQPQPPILAAASSGDH